MRTGEVLTAHRRPLAVTATTLATVADLGPLAATDVALLVADAFRSCSAEPGRVVQLDLPVQPDPTIQAARRLRGIESAPDRYFVVPLTNLLGAGCCTHSSCSPTSSTWS